MAKSVVIEIDDDLFRDIQIRAAEKGSSMQQYIVGAVKSDLFPAQPSLITEDQMEQLKGALEMVDQALGEVADILWGGQEQAAGGMSMEL